MNEDDNRDNPFVGLRPFFDEDSFYFFGRNEQVTELLELLHGTHFVPVLGSSGSGKSSLVRAGLIPILRAGFMIADRDGWRMAKCLPGDAPIENLAEALLRSVGVERTPPLVNALATRIREDFDDAVIDVLRPHLSPHESILILVDQFEEIFAFRGAAGAEADDEPDSVPDAALTADRLRRRRDASLLVSVLLALAERKDVPVYVVTTMRTDFLGDCDLFTGLPEAINRSGYLVPRLTRAQLRSAIEGPARLVGARAAPRLVDRILNDVGDRMDRLPLMQHALLRTFEAWKSAGMMGPMDFADLEKIGGLDGALNVQAEATIADIDPGVAERVFKRLTAIDRNQRRVRHPTRLNDLRTVAGTEHAAALTTLLDRCVREGTNFMFASPDGEPGNLRYNITHESLIRQWDRLRKWVDEEQVQRDWYFTVASRAALYASDADSGLMSRRDLRIAQEIITERAPTAGWATRYPEAATTFDDAMRYVDRSARHAKAVSRNWVLGVAAILILVIGGTLKVLASGQLAKEALARVDEVARFAAIERLLGEDPTYAAALAAELTDTTVWKPDRVALLQQALNADYAAAEYRQVESVDFDRAGTSLALGYIGGRIEVRSADGVGEPRAVFRATETDTTVQLYFVKGGVAAGYRDGTVRLWRTGDGPSSTPITTPTKSWKLAVPIRRLMVTADLTSFVALDDSSHLFTWSIEEAEPRALLPNARIRDIYSHPTNPHRTVVVTVTEGDEPSAVDSLRVIDVKSGSTVATVKGITKFIMFVSFKDSTDEMLVGQFRGKVLYTKADAVVGAIGDSTGYVSAAFNPAYEIVMLTTGAGFVDLYRLRASPDGKHKALSRISHAHAHEEAAYGQFSRDGEWTLSWSTDGAIRWALALDSTVSTRLTGQRAVVFWAVAPLADSRTATWDMDGTLRIWRKPNIIQAVPYSTSPRGPWDAVLAEHGSRVLLTFGVDQFVVRTLTDSATTPPFGMPTVVDLASANVRAQPVISPSGLRVFFDQSPAGDQVIRNVRAGTSATVPKSIDPVQIATFSDDDSVLVLARAGGRIAFLDANTGAPRRTAYVHPSQIAASAVAIAPHTNTVAIAFDDSVFLFKGDSVIGLDRQSTTSSVVDLKFSADGNALAIVDVMGGIGVARLGARRSPSDTFNFEVDNGGRGVNATAMSARGSLLAIATDDRAIWIFNLRDTTSGAVPTQIKGLEGSTVHLTFGADEHTLVATGGDGDIHIWQLTSTGKLVKGATPLVLQHAPKVPHQRNLPQARTALSADGRTLTSVVIPDSGVPRVGTWVLDYARVRERLAHTTSACVDIELRQRLLPHETDAERRERTDACEKRAGRVK